MIPTGTDVVEVTSNITGETGSFTVDSESLGKIMGVLTNLYSDPEAAVVREYATNALDSQIEAQENDPKYKWRPVEVTLPTRFDKEYKIRDYGVGMSTDDIRDTYSKYGKSTKETSNSVTGMLGLGSKCALTYTNQFNITGYKNGIMTQAIITKDENDVPVFMILDTKKTTEPNGVEISIPVKDNNTFAQKTAAFFKFWETGQVLVNGQQPELHGYKVEKTFEHKYTLGGKEYKGDVNVYLIDRNPNDYYASYKQSYVVMGNVNYEVAAEHVPQALRDAGMGFVAYVPMGSVTFPPNREVLTYNKRTKELVEKIGNGLFEDILNARLVDVTNCTNFRDAWLKYTELPDYFKNHPIAANFMFKGHKFPDRFQQDYMSLTWDYKGNGNVYDRKSIDASAVMKSVAVIVTDVAPDTKPTSYFKKKVRYYMEQHNLTGDNAMLVDNDILDMWFTHIKRVDADTIKAIKLPTNSPVGPRIATPFDYYTSGVAGCKSDVIVPVPKDWVLTYVSPQDIKETYRKSGCDPSTLVNMMGDNVILVVTGKNRFDKFKRDHPTAKSLSAVVQEKVNEYVDKATDAEYIIGQLQYGETNFLEKVKPDDLDDTDLADLAKLVQTKNRTDNYEKAERLYGYARRAQVHITLPAKKNVSNTVTKKYPLIEHVGSRKIEHLVIYCNAVYAV